MTEADIEAALRHYRKADPVLHKAARNVRRHLAPRTPLRTRDALFASLAEAVVSQQLSVKASDTIWKRLTQACGGKVTAASVARVPLPRMRKAGLSAAKAKTLKALAKAVGGGLDLPSLKRDSPALAAERLTAVWGIGPWTAEMFLMFGLGHPDIFSARDLGLVRAMESLYGLKHPSIKRLETIALAWSPYRSVACRILWKTRDLPDSSP